LILKCSGKDLRILRMGFTSEIGFPRLTMEFLRSLILE